MSHNITFNQESPSNGLRVVYSGSVQIPFCYGSISVPLTLPSDSSIFGTGSRYTHRRFCYVRDGGEIELDAFYRWMWHENRSSQAPGRKRNHDAKMSYAIRSPSTFYSVVDHVDFIVPKSFQQSRRSVTEPPYMVEDDTWAEHIVEFHIYFLEELAIPPIAVLHPCLLHPRAGTAPVLRSVLPDTATNAKVSGGNNTQFPNSESSEYASPSRRDSSQALVVSERKDSIRIIHPSTEVVKFFRNVITLSREPQLQSVFADFLIKDYQQVGYNEEWRLCYESCIKEYTEKRAERTQAALDLVLLQLQQEKKELEESAAMAITKMIVECESVHKALTRFRKSCLSVTQE